MVEQGSKDELEASRHGVTEGDRVEQALRASEERYRELFDNVPIGIYRTTPSGQIENANPYLVEMLGYSSFAQLAERNLEQSGFEPEYCRSDFRNRIEREGAVSGMEARWKRRDGSTVVVRENAKVVRDADGKVLFYEGTVEDITKRKRAEEALRKERDFSTSLVQASPTFFVAIDGRGKTVMMNVAMLTALGYAEEEVMGTDYLETFVPQAEREPLAGIFDQLVRLNEPTLNENRVLTKDGRELLVEWHGRPVFKENGDLDFFFGVGIDITERRRAEEALREREELLYAVVHATQDAMISIGDDGLITLFNPAAEKMFGRKRKEMLGQPVDCLMPEEYRGPHAGYVKSYFATGKPDRAVGQVLEMPGLRRDGTVFPMDISLSTGKVGDKQLVIAVGRDVTERKRLEAQFQQSQKMEAMGFLAGGIAHDFNNLLTAILANAEFVLGKLQQDPPADDRYLTCLTSVVNAGNRAVSLTRQLLAFGRRQEITPVVLDLNTALAEVEELLPWVVRERIELTVNRHPDLWRTHADPTQIEQIIMNLAVNARDAMPDGGKLTIETANVTLDEDYVAEHPEAHSGPHAALYVSDTGVGMSKDTIDRIFEPFFTTKPVGEGTGLGLSTVFGIVKQAGGHVTVESEEGKGTAFRVYLPVVDERKEQPVAAPSAAVVAEGDLGGDETILVCEDEDDVRRLARQILEGKGYKVFTAANGRKGLELAAGYSDPIHLLLTDIIMPEMSGPQLAEALGKARPDMKILYMSGYSSNVLDVEELSLEKMELLDKPFSSDDLLIRVRGILNC